MSTPPNVKAFSVSLPGVKLEDVDDPNKPTQVASSQSDTSSGFSDYMPILLLFFALLMLLLMVVR